MASALHAPPCGWSNPPSNRAGPRWRVMRVRHLPVQVDLCVVRPALVAQIFYALAAWVDDHVLVHVKQSDVVVAGTRPRTEQRMCVDLRAHQHMQVSPRNNRDTLINASNFCISTRSCKSGKHSSRAAEHPRRTM